jgi:hypothetical protein
VTRPDFSIDLLHAPTPFRRAFATHTILTLLSAVHRPIKPLSIDGEVTVQSMRYEPQVQLASIVLVGRFNPAIFSPAWFAKVGIISDAELDESKVGIVHSEVTQFSLDRFKIDVFPERFSITTPNEPFVQILDDTLSTFQQLPHSLVTVFGINYEIHFNLDSADQRIALGRALAPVTPWKDFGQRLGGSTPDRVGGLVSLVMQETPTDRDIGYRQVKIERSAILRSPASVMMHVNDHFEIVNAKAEDGAEPGMKLLRERFDGSLIEAKKIVAQLMKFAEEL